MCVCLWVCVYIKTPAIIHKCVSYFKNCLISILQSSILILILMPWVSLIIIQRKKKWITKKRVRCVRYTIYGMRSRSQISAYTNAGQYQRRCCLGNIENRFSRANQYSFYSTFCGPPGIIPTNIFVALHINSWLECVGICPEFLVIYIVPNEFSGCCRWMS